MAAEAKKQEADRTAQGTSHSSDMLSCHLLWKKRRDVIFNCYFVQRIEEHLKTCIQQMEEDQRTGRGNKSL